MGKHVTVKFNGPATEWAVHHVTSIDVGDTRKAYLPDDKEYDKDGCRVSFSDEVWIKDDEGDYVCQLSDGFEVVEEVV